MTAPHCSLCGAAIPEGAPHESWEWDDIDAWRHENPDAPDPADNLGEDDDDPEYLVTLYAHPGCRRLQRLVDVSDWEEGSLSELVAEWVEDASTTIEREDRARLAAAEAAGCEYAEWSVGRALQ